MNFCSRKIFIIYVLNFLLFVLLFQNIISLEKEDEDFILPDEYDLREEYKDCKSLRDIRDQYRCGGCWAFTVAEVISDRICIKSKGKEQPIISENELITCCNFCFNETSLKKGCGGGYVSSAYLYWIYFGLPTEECKPFHRYYTEKEYIAGNLKCLPRCENGNRKPTRYYGSNIDFIFKNENEKTDINIIKRDEKKIMNEIYEHGSVSASFKIYGNGVSDDFDEFFRKNSNKIYGSTPENELKKNMVII
jgi:cathepsin B